MSVSQRIGVEWSEGSHSRQTVKYGLESRGTRNQESLCWRGPAAIDWTGHTGRRVARLPES
jgi:hypothetical protein